MWQRAFVYAAAVLAFAATTLGFGPGGSEVADAVQGGDRPALLALIAKKADVNAPQVDGTTALHWAVYRNDVDAVDALIRAGATVKAITREGISPIYMAALGGNPAIVRLLLRAGGNAKELGPSGETTVMLASRNGSSETIKLLLDAGVNVNAAEPLRGTTALMWAAEQRHPVAVQTLLAAGADVNARSKPGGTARSYMANQVNTNATLNKQRQLLDEAAAKGLTPPSGAGFDGVAAPVSAAGAPSGRGGGGRGGAGGGARGTGGPAGAGGGGGQNPPGGGQGGGRGGRGTQGGRGGGQGGGRGAQGGGRGGQGGGGAQAAAGRGAGTPAPVVGQADPEAADAGTDQADEVVAGLVGSDNGGLTALVFAAREGDIESANLLLKAKADVNQATGGGWSPLLTAVNNRNYGLALSLIEHGANVNLANNVGWTPLYLATDNRNIEGGDYPVPKADIDHLEVIKALLDHGANPNARVSQNTLTRTIFTMQWFFEPGATPFIRAAQSGDLELLKLLLAKGAEPKAVTDHGDTALSAVAGIGWVPGVTYEWSPQQSFETSKFLLDLGLDPNSANRDGRTPLMAAAFKGRNDIIQLLVDRGAKLETRDRGSRDTDNANKILGGHTWQAIDYADGLVRVGVQSAVVHTESVALLRKLMIDRGLPVPSPNRTLDSICIVAICQKFQ